MKIIVCDLNGNIVDPKEKEITIDEYYKALDSFSTMDESA